MMKRLRITVCAVLVLMLLAGCAGSPSFTNMKKESSAHTVILNLFIMIRLRITVGGADHRSPPNRLRLPRYRRRL